MNTVVFTCKQDRFLQVESSGHTGYAQSGQDIVCAAVSAILQTAVMGVLQVAGLAGCQYSVDDRKGHLCLILPIEGYTASQMEQATAILQTALLGIQDISSSYPKYVKLEVKTL